MAGPAIRAAELARALAARCDVTLAAPGAERGAGRRRALLEAGHGGRRARSSARRASTTWWSPRSCRRPRSAARRAAPARLVADLYNPIVVEVLEAVAHRLAARAAALRDAIAARTLALLAAADLVLCASERQRDLWIGALASRD